jgi:hypothetical protein
MLVFIDESGDPGMNAKPGTSVRFTVTAVVFPDPRVGEACAASICELRRKLGVHEQFEFHFNKCSRRFREQFLSTVAAHKFFYHAFVLNKEKLYDEGFNHKSSFYKFAVGIVFENLNPHLKEASVTFDRFGDREFKRELSKYLKRRTATDDGKVHIKKIKMEDSSSNHLLQLADMVCGAIARLQRLDKADREVYRKLIRHREWKVRHWP